MWIFRNDAFVSLVQDRDMPDQLWARARVRGDIERFFERCLIGEVIETPEADYRFRLAVDRGTVKSALQEAVNGIDYENFKNSIGHDPVENERHNAYLRVWTAMMGLQRWVLDRELRARSRGKKKGAQS